MKTSWLQVSWGFYFKNHIIQIVMSNKQNCIQTWKHFNQIMSILFTFVNIITSTSVLSTKSTHISMKFIFYLLGKIYSDNMCMCNNKMVMFRVHTLPTLYTLFIYVQSYTCRDFNQHHQHPNHNGCISKTFYITTIYLHIKCIYHIMLHQPEIEIYKYFLAEVNLCKFKCTKASTILL